MIVKLKRAIITGSNDGPAPFTRQGAIELGLNPRKVLVRKGTVLSPEWVHGRPEVRWALVPVEVPGVRIAITAIVPGKFLEVTE